MLISWFIFTTVCLAGTSGQGFSEHDHHHGHDHGQISHGVDPLRVRPLDQGRGAIGAVWDRRAHHDPLRRHGEQNSRFDGLAGLRNQFHRDLNRPNVPLDPLGPHVPIDPHLGPHYNDVIPRKYDGGHHRQLRKNKRKLEKKIKKAIKKHKKKARKIKIKSQKKLQRQARRGRKTHKRLQKQGKGRRY